MWLAINKCHSMTEKKGEDTPKKGCDERALSSKPSLAREPLQQTEAKGR